MTNLPAGPTPPGWYPDPAGTQAERWWDGSTWTDNVKVNSTPQGATPYSVVGYADPKAPEGTSPYNKWIWLNLILQIVACIPVLLFPWDSYFTSMLQSSSTGSLSSDPMAGYAVLLSPEYLAITGFSYLCVGLTIFFGWLDYRALKAAGVPKPFHWAWGFFILAGAGFLVYVIGRSVVVRRRTGSGLAPIWIYVASQVLITIAFVVIFVGVIANMMSNYSYGP
jgi:hypothetical protein